MSADNAALLHLCKKACLAGLKLTQGLAVVQDIKKKQLSFELNSQKSHVWINICLELELREADAEMQCSGGTSNT